MRTRVITRSWWPAVDGDICQACVPPMLTTPRSTQKDTPVSPLPTEEDVLTALLLRAARPRVTDYCDSAQCLDQAAWDQAVNVSRLSWENVVPMVASEIAQRRLAELTDLEVAIADSERLLDVSAARDAVVEAARAWGTSIFAGKRNNGDLLAAVCVLEAAEMGVL